MARYSATHVTLHVPRWNYRNNIVPYMTTSRTDYNIQELNIYQLLQALPFPTPINGLSFTTLGLVKSLSRPFHSQLSMERVSVQKLDKFKLCFIKLVYHCVFIASCVTTMALNGSISIHPSYWLWVCFPILLNNLYICVSQQLIQFACFTFFQRLQQTLVIEMFVITFAR